MEQLDDLDRRLARSTTLQAIPGTLAHGLNAGLAATIDAELDVDTDRELRGLRLGATTRGLYPRAVAAGSRHYRMHAVTVIAVGQGNYPGHITAAEHRLNAEVRVIAGLPPETIYVIDVARLLGTSTADRYARRMDGMPPGAHDIAPLHVPDELNSLNVVLARAAAATPPLAVTGARVANPPITPLDRIEEAAIVLVDEDDDDR